MPFMAIGAFAVLVEAWCFIINSSVERSAFALFLKSWFGQSAGRLWGLPVPGRLILLALTIGGGIGLMYAEMPRLPKRQSDFKKIAKVSLGFMVSVWLAMGILAGIFWTTLDASVSSPTNISLRAEARITLFLSGLLLLVAGTAWSLVASDPQRYATAGPVCLRSCWIGFPLAIGAIVVIAWLALRPAWADITYRIARVYEASGDLSSAMRLYERAITLAPHVVQYRISLGLCPSRAGVWDPNPVNESAQSLPRALDLNPLDPASYRAIGTFYTQTGERAPDLALRNKAMLFFSRLSGWHPITPTHTTSWAAATFCSGILPRQTPFTRNRCEGSRRIHELTCSLARCTTG
jgi:tetratricopeptide (TPR) repeat protein